MTELHELTASDQLRALRTRQISSRELTEHYLGRIDKLDEELGAFVTVVPDGALAEADHADARLAQGEASPLLGLPFAIKDLYPTAGVRTTCGSAALSDLVPPQDGWTVGLIRQAGAVLVGKTNASELGATCFTENGVTPRPAVTPYDTTRYSSGSSGGAATAVAAGMTPMAHGSDGAGSIRTPAATCHLVGMKPTRGLVSPAQVSSFFSTSIEGPITRTVADAALLMDVMAHPWAGDLHGWTPRTGFTQGLDRAPSRPLRIAMWTGTGVEGVPVHSQSEVAAQRAARVLRELGHDVTEIAVPAAWDDTVERAIVSWFATSVAVGVNAMIPFDRRDRLTPFIQYLLGIGEALTGVETAMGQAVLAQYAGAFLASLQDFDAALTPTTAGPPVPIGHFDQDGLAGVVDRMRDWSCYTPWVNLAGVPAVALPSHLDDEGLPHGVQLVGRCRHDVELLALAGQLETAGLWDDIHPNCWGR